MRRSTAKIEATAVAMLAAASASACSELGADSSIEQALWFGWAALLAQSVLAVCLLLRFWASRKGPGHPVVVALLTLLHPAFWIDPYSGDCGARRESLSVLFLGAVVVLLVWQEAVHHSRRRTPPTS